MGADAKDPRFAAFYGLMVVEWRLSERLDAELADAVPGENGLDDERAAQ